MTSLRTVDPAIDRAIRQELQRQHDHLELIASENFTSPAVLEAQGSVLTNKYAEGYPKARWYGGCEFVDIVEQLALDRVTALFGGEHANVQPHSGTEANIAALYATLQAGDKILAMSLAHGGHLSHGHPKNFSGKYFTIIPYGVDKTTEQISYDEIAALAKAHRPKMVLAGYSAYPRLLDFKRFREIADSVGALLMVDMAHFAGLVAGGCYPNPTPHADLVTSTTHKTLRGPRGGFILCRQALAKAIDSAVFPGVQGGPLMHVVAAKAVCFQEASLPEFKAYARQVVANAKTLAAALSKRGYRIVSGGTENHLMLVDLTPKALTGKEAQEALDAAGMTVNKNAIPFDPLPPGKASGIRVGTPAVTTRGMQEPQMERIAELMDQALAGRSDAAVLARVHAGVKELAEQFPLYLELRTAHEMPVLRPSGR